MDRLQAMHVFVRVAELGSFSAVAQQLGVARSVITRQIAALEEHLGIKLMVRSTRRLTLTSAGAGVRKVHSNYHIPISNTATGVLALETI